jgi:deoxyribonuclease V
VRGCGRALPEVWGRARAGAEVAADAAFWQVLAEHTAVVPDVPPYGPGEFCRRELPPLRAVLRGIGGLGLLVVDGYADLDPAGRPGLGAHAHGEFGVAVIGVAKSAFRPASHAGPGLRGTSRRPLFVTAAGLPSADAAELVYGWPVPGTRCAAPGGQARPHRPDGGCPDQSAPPLIDVRIAADEDDSTWHAAYPRRG